ncbi:unnamed protein product, partial [Lampetra planeri]
EEVDRNLCSSTPAPEPVPCEVPCSRDCVLSDWTPWSSCSQTCSSKTIEGKQMRTRSILAYNAGEGGALCPNSSALQEVRNCNEHACTVYHWQTGPWGLCTEDPSVSALNTSAMSARSDGQGTCAKGMQTRKVICVRVNVGQVPPKKCPDGPRPSTVRPCQLPCKKDCIMTPFSNWTSCPVTCDAAGNAVQKKQSRKRLIIQMPSNGGQECPEVLEEERDCEVPKTCPGVSWMGTQADISKCLKSAKAMPAITQRCQLPCQDDCQLTNWSKFTSCTADCVGVRTRKRALIGYIEEACIIPCPSDCKLSEWSNWSRCSKSCGSGVKVRSKWLREKPYNGGRPCPKLDHINQVYEVVPCQSDCNQYVWVAEPWSVWKVSNVDLKENCGEGVQTRKVRCMLNTVDGPSEPVEDYLCDPEEMPLGARESRLPCPEDCVLNDWGPWSRCSLVRAVVLPTARVPEPTVECGTAKTLRPPSVGRQCPEPSDKEPCSLNLNCFNYFYNIT